VATFDQLTADQRAIIELVLQRGKSYHELADLLAMPEARVRELARSALSELTPITASRVEEDWRNQLADYVLGQQTGPESTATKGHLRRSEAARAFTRSLLDSLDTLYTNGLPQVPEGERATRERLPRRAEREQVAPAEVAPRRSLSAEAQSAVRRRRLLAAMGGVGVIGLVAILLWPIGVLTGGDDDNGDGKASATSTQNAASRGPSGLAVIAQRGSQRQAIVQAQGLKPTGQREAYEVWLYNSRSDAKSLGAQVTDAKGTYQGAGPLPSDFQKYKYIDVSREPIDPNRGHSGQSVLRGSVPKLSPPPASTPKGQAAILGQSKLNPVK
jgi:anti-sigma-K factor RskA/sigma-70-like protein